MSADVIILFAGDRGWRDRTIFRPHLLTPANSSLVTGEMSLSAGDGGGQILDHVAEGDQRPRRDGIFQRQAANVAGRIKQIGGHLIGVFHRRPLLDLETAARMGENSFDVDSNNPDILA